MLAVRIRIRNGSLHVELLGEIPAMVWTSMLQKIFVTLEYIVVCRCIYIEKYTAWLCMHKSNMHIDIFIYIYIYVHMSDVQYSWCELCTLKLGECCIGVQVWGQYTPHVENLTALFTTVGGSVVGVTFTKVHPFLDTFAEIFPLILSSWWFQPIWKRLVKLDHFPR